MSVDLLAAVAPAALLGLVVLLAFVKISVVLAVLRSGLGAGIPPRLVTGLLALLLAGIVAVPIAERCHQAMLAAPAGELSARLDAGAAPLREFLLKHTPMRELTAVQDLARRLAPPTENTAPAPTPADAKAPPEVTAPTTALPALRVVAAAFVLGELRVAFTLGFVLLLPFLLIDLLCASLLSGLSLGSLSPRAVALPFKLLLFVVCDGWNLLARGLLLGYG